MARIASRAERSLFRSLLRLAVRFDQNPGAKLLFYRKRLLPTTDVADFGAGDYFGRELIPLLFGEEHSQAKLLHPKGTATCLYSLVRTEFRKPHEDYSLTDRIDAAFIAVRKLSSLWSCFRTMRASEKEADAVQSLLHSERSIAAAAPGGGGGGGGGISATQVAAGQSLSATPTDFLLPGIILVSHPMIQGPLKRAVILLLEHNTGGSYGVVINRPTEQTLATAVKNLPASILSSFGQSRVRFGGSVRRLQYLHRFPQVSGTPIPLCAGPFFSGGKIESATRMVQEDDSLRRDFHFFVGCCTWDADELAAELATGYWLPIKSQADKVVSLATAARHAAAKEDSVSAVAAAATAASSETASAAATEASGSSPSSSLDAAIAELSTGRGLLEDHRDLWSTLVRNMGNAYRPAMELAPYIDASNVESLDS